MGMNMKLVIADDEKNICEMFKSLIEFEQIGLELSGMAYDGESLCRMIEEQAPDIVITDISMPKMDGLRVIQYCRERQINCRFIVVSGYRQFEYAYNALKYNVSDYLLKPVNEEELNQVLYKVADEIRREKKGESVSQKEELLQHYFLTNVLENTSVKNEARQDYEEINQSYMLHLKEGAFLYVYLKLDDKRQERRTYEELTSVLKKLKRMVHQRLDAFCYDVIVQERADSLKSLINYRPSQQEQLEKELKELFEAGRNITDIFNGLHFTVCVGKPFYDLDKAVIGRRQAWTAMFARLGLGTNRIIFFKQLHTVDLRDKLNQWDKEIVRAWKTLDTEAFRACMEDMFSQPSTVMCSYDFATFIPRIQEIGEEEKKHLSAANDIHAETISVREMAKAVDICTTFEECRDAITRYNCEEIGQLAGLVDKKNIKPIRLACDYVREHLGEAIRQEDVAALVGLSPAYFSALFTKKTGQTFSEYVTVVRIQRACELLERSDNSIGEIASMVGLEDARYFSKLFRKRIGIKPTEYRKIYG